MKRVSLALLATCLLAACSKKNETEPNNNSSNDNLNAIEKMVIGKWKFESSSNGTNDYLQDCDMDDVFTFTSEKYQGHKKYVYDKGSNTCQGNGPNGDFSWEVIASDSTFDFTHNPPPSQFKCKIKSIDGNTMVLKVTSFSSEALTVMKKI
jgi:hypothetical protein